MPHLSLVIIMNAMLLLVLMHSVLLHLAAGTDLGTYTEGCTKGTMRRTSW